MIDYAVISNNSNPEYRGLRDKVTKRWNDLGIKVIYVDVCDSAKDLINPIREVDEFGNQYFPIVHKFDTWWLVRYFDVMIARFILPTLPEFKDKTFIISDGDLFPINKRYIYCPSVTLSNGKFESLLDEGYLVTTNHYPNLNSLATYTYGKGSTFSKLFEGLCHESLEDMLTEVERHAGNVSRRKLCKMYITDEEYLNYCYNNSSKIKVHKVLNRFWKEAVQEMNNLYDYQIQYLSKPVDLSPFIEFHNFRTSTVNEEMWSKLFNLLIEFDKLDVCPNNWYYETINDPWRDTIISKNGELILGDEYNL